MDKLAIRKRVFKEMVKTSNGDPTDWTFIFELTREELKAAGEVHYLNILYTMYGEGYFTIENGFYVPTLKGYLTYG